MLCLRWDVPVVSSSLRELIRSRLDRFGWSYGDVARRGGISRSTVHHLATAPRLARMPQEATLEGLARGLGVPVEPLRRAAAEAAGVSLYYESVPEQADPEVEILIASVCRLSAADRRHVAVLVESLLTAGAEEGEEAGGEGGAEETG
ncbi:helix-turn-helix transcriptional regulator [Streptomyces sp. SID4985]|uniref:helix-turn-helix domain-containing protein n=1 Tax=Streptomyces sp. SID4985 TaxID=2690292 RepID=UPI0019273978|nr:helix-turn-helix transcriptional regulator [Streptomyces sp. SID4985]